MNTQVESMNLFQKNFIGVSGVNSGHLDWNTSTAKEESQLEYDIYDPLEDGTYIISSALLPGSAMFTSDEAVNADGEYSLFVDPEDTNNGASIQTYYYSDIKRQPDESYIISSRVMITSTAKRNQYGDWFLYMSPEDKMCLHSGKLRFYIDRQEDGTFVIASAMIFGSAMCVSTQEKHSQGERLLYMSTYDRNEELPGKWRFNLERIM